MLKTEPNTWTKIATKTTISNSRIFGVIIPMNRDGLKEKIRV
jgi:hypothetical protein